MRIFGLSDVSYDLYIYNIIFLNNIETLSHAYIIRQYFHEKSYAKKTTQIN